MLLNWDKKRLRGPSFLPSGNRLGPYFCRRAEASVAPRPFSALVASRFTTSPTGMACHVTSRGASIPNLQRCRFPKLMPPMVDQTIRRYEGAALLYSHSRLAKIYPIRYFKANGAANREKRHHRSAKQPLTRFHEMTKSSVRCNRAKRCEHVTVWDVLF